MIRLRELCPEHLRGFPEGMKCGMPGYVRGDVYEREDEIGFAAQKEPLSFHVVRTDVMAAHRDRLDGPSVGKGCIRIRRAVQLDETVVRSILELTAGTRGPIC